MAEPDPPAASNLLRYCGVALVCSALCVALLVSLVWLNGGVPN